MSVTRGRYSFHSRAGQLAQITNDGVTARRKESRIYLDNAVLIGAQPLEDGKMFEVLIQEKVTRWLGLIGGSIAIGCTTSRPEAVSLPNSLSSFRQDSWIMLGSALVKHGRQQIKNYGQDLNSLNVKDTVGIARIGRQLKFYVNGTDQGTAEDNLPPVVYPMVDLYGKCTRISILSPESLSGGAGAVVEAPLQFHKNCGKNIRISSNGQRARRQGADDINGIVISNRPLRDSELFEVRITDMNDQDTGIDSISVGMCFLHADKLSIEVGITTIQPDTMELPDIMELPETMVLPDTMELPNNMKLVFNIQSKTWWMGGCLINLNRRMLASNYGINLNSLKVGDRVGVMCTESGEFHVIINGSDMGPAVSNIQSSVYGIINIYGRCTEVELVHDSSISPRAEPATPTLVSRDHDMCFSHIHGANAMISDDRKTVKRCIPYRVWNNASVFSNRPLNRNELFEVSIDKLIDNWSELSLELGVIGIDPAKLDLTGLGRVTHASENNVPVWMMSRNKLTHNNNNNKELEDYGLDLNSLPEGSKVGLMVNDIGELHYYHNGQDKGCAFTGIPEGVYAAVDVFSNCAEISICHSGSWEIMLAKLEQAKANNKVIKVSYTTILFTGSSGVGKTTLLKKLNKEDLNRYHDSTGVAKSTHKVCIKTTAVVKTTEGLQWTDLDYDSMIQYLNKYLHDIRFPPSRVTAATLPLKEKIPSSSEGETEDQQSIPKSLTSASSVTVTKNVSVTSAANETVTKKKVAKAELAAVDIAKANSSNTPLLGEVWDIVNFLDTGGQPEFVNILPAISSSVALTFIVFNLKKNLSELVHVQHNINGDPSFEPYYLDCSNLEFIKRLMVSTENFHKNVSSSLQLKRIQRKDKENDSKICYMGTHALGIKEEKIKEIDDQLSTIASELELHQRSFWASPEPQLKRLFPVDMFPTNKEKESFEEIIEVVRENIQSQVQERDYYDVPIGWFIFLLNLQKLCNMKKISYVSYHEAVNTWMDESVSLKVKSHQSSQVIREETEVHNVLLFFHFMGMLFYYHKVKGIRDFVFIDRQWLFEKLTELVEIKFTKDFNKKKISAEIIDKFTLEGRLNIDIIENLKVNLQGIQPLYFIHLLDHLNIVAPIDSKMEEYFMPCVLPSFTGNLMDLDKFYGTIKHAPLLVGFKNGPMPHGFFCQMVVELLRKLPTDWLSPLLSTSKMQYVYNNLITFPTTSGHAVALFYRIGYLEIQVRHKKSQSTVIHCVVRHELDKILRKVSDHLQLNKKQLCYGFYCKFEGIQHFVKLEELTPTAKYFHCKYHGQTEITEEYSLWLQEAKYCHRNSKQLQSGTWHPEATRKVYHNFRLKLVISLPMDDVIFLELLRKENLFLCNLLGEVQAKSTKAEKAAWFLDKAVEPSLCIDKIKPFCKLLVVMSDNEYLKSDFLSGLAKEMQQELDKETLLISMKNLRADTDDSATKDDSPHPAVTGEGSKAITQ